MSTSAEELYGIQVPFNQGWWLPQYEQQAQKAKIPLTSAQSAGLKQTQEMIDKGICLGLCATWVTRRIENPNEAPKERCSFVTRTDNIQSAVERQLLHMSRELRDKETIKLAVDAHRAETKAATNANIPESRADEVARNRDKATFTSLLTPSNGPITGHVGIDRETQEAFSLSIDLQLDECTAGENSILLKGDETERFKQNAIALISDNLNYYLISVRGANNGHAMICYRTESKTIFFDPNYGEYAVDGAKLEAFFGYIYNRYKTDFGAVANYKIILIRPATRARSMATGSNNNTSNNNTSG
jgi:hypothetical protein